MIALQMGIGVTKPGQYRFRGEKHVLDAMSGLLDPPNSSHGKKPEASSVALPSHAETAGRERARHEAGARFQHPSGVQERARGRLRARLNTHKRARSSKDYSALSCKEERAHSEVGARSLWLPWAQERALFGSHGHRSALEGTPYIGYEETDENWRPRREKKELHETVVLHVFAHLLNHIFILYFILQLAQIKAMSCPQAKPLRSQCIAADQRKMVVCHFCGVSVAAEALQQHRFWNVQCMQLQHERSGMSCRKARRAARKLYELRQWKMEQVLSEVRRSVASRPGAKAMAKPLKATKRQSKSSS